VNEGVLIAGATMSRQLIHSPNVSQAQRNEMSLFRQLTRCLGCTHHSITGIRDSLMLNNYSFDGNRKCISILGHTHTDRFMVSAAVLLARCCVDVTLTCFIVAHREAIPNTSY
jgi:hypothetical protein